MALLCQVFLSQLLFFLPLWSWCHHLCWLQLARGTSSSLADAEGESIQHVQLGEERDPKSSSVPETE